LIILLEKSVVIKGNFFDTNLKLADSSNGLDVVCSQTISPFRSEISIIFNDTILDYIIKGDDGLL
jgi:hypothetical protein